MGGIWLPNLIHDQLYVFCLSLFLQPTKGFLIFIDHTYSLQKELVQNVKSECWWFHLRQNEVIFQKPFPFPFIMTSLFLTLSQINNCVKKSLFGTTKVIIIMISKEHEWGEKRHEKKVSVIDVYWDWPGRILKEGHGHGCSFR